MTRVVVKVLVKVVVVVVVVMGVVVVGVVVVGVVVVGVVVEEVRVGRFVVKGNRSRLQVESRKVERTDPSHLQSGMPDLKAPQ